MDIVRQSLAITFVFALLWLALWLLRKRAGNASNLRANHHGAQVLESRGKLALSAQHSLHLVQVRDRQLVLAVHPGGMTLVCELGTETARSCEEK